VLAELGGTEREDRVLVAPLGEAGHDRLGAEVQGLAQVVIANLRALLQVGVLAQRLGIDLLGAEVIGRGLVGGVGQVERLLGAGQVPRVQLGRARGRDQVGGPAGEVREDLRPDPGGQRAGQLRRLAAEPADVGVVDVVHHAGDGRDELLVVGIGGQFRRQLDGRRNLALGQARIHAGEGLVVHVLERVPLSRQGSVDGLRAHDRQPMLHDEPLGVKLADITQVPFPQLRGAGVVGCD